MLHDLAVAQVVPEALAGAEADQAQEAVRALAARIPPEDVQLYYQIALTGVRELPYAPDMRIAFEMTLLRMLAFQPEEGDGQGGAPDGGTSKAAPDPAPQAPPGTEALRGMLADTPSVTPASAIVAPEPVPPEPGPPESARDLAPEPAPVQPAPARQALSGALAGLDEPAAEAAAPATKPDPDPDPDHEAPREAKFEPEIPGATQAEVPPDPFPEPLLPRQWGEALRTLGLTGVTLEVAQHCVLLGDEGDRIRFALAPEAEPLFAPVHETRLAEALSTRRGRTVRVQLEIASAEAETPAQRAARGRAEAQAAAEQAIENDQEVQALQAQFGARIIPGSLRPREDGGAHGSTAGPTLH